MMKYLKLVTLTLLLNLLLIPSVSGLKAAHYIIPEPVYYKELSSKLQLSSFYRIDSIGKGYLPKVQVNALKAYLNSHGYAESSDPAKGFHIAVEMAPNDENKPEEYQLEAMNNEFEVNASSNEGIHNAFQTIKQILPVDGSKAKEAQINGFSISDYPRFQWRGLMLDVSRHFFTVEEIKQFIDQMSVYKFNVFHWHLTDDNGWRIEIKSLPKLTEAGAWRVERHGAFNHRAKPKFGEATPYGGFYTQEQIKEVIKYAQDRNVTIIPEIDVPGHSMAALAAYPELSTLKEKKMVSPGHKFAVWPGDGTFKMLEENTLDPSNPAVYEFLDKVFGEVAALFPAKYIHMGGDEAFKGYWENSAQVKAFMKENNIRDSHELQSYFVGRVQKIINSKGKQMIGWDEIIEGGLKKGATVMSWQGMKGGIHAAKKSHEVVMSPTTYAYLDYQQGDKVVENSIYANLSLEKSYEFEPIPEGVDSALILGGQANIWTEAIPTLPFVFYMTYPRAMSVAETVWSPKEKKNWSSFIERVQTHFDRLDESGVNVCKAVLEPQVHVFKQGGKIMCELKNNVPGTDIYYSVNNTYPVNYASKYEKPFEIPEGKLRLRTQCFKNGKASGRELIIDRKDLVKRAK